MSAYTVNGGEGLLPFAVGNRWEYALMTPDTARPMEPENVFEVTGCENGTITVANMTFYQTRGYADTWEGKTLEAIEGYAREVDDDNSVLCDILPALTRAEELATSKRQKVHTAIANDVMRRIFDTDPEWNPDYREMGWWNFFDRGNIVRKDGKVTLGDNRKYSFEWRDIDHCRDEGYKVLYSFLLAILQDAMGCLWSDEWTDGYRISEITGYDAKTTDVRVTGGETVVTPAGTFTDCRRLHLHYGANYYFCGESDYWFAPGVGVVKFEHPRGERPCVRWQLTEYRGTGEGYFPTDDGLFRRYEPDTLTDGWHGSVEFTFDEDENGTVMFKNALGTRDRADYEAAIKG